MKELNSDLHIVGGALTGLITAYCSSALGLKIIITEKRNIYKNNNEPLDDTRTTAIAEGSKIFLETQGLWRHIKKFAEPIKNIKVIDHSANSKIDFINPTSGSNLGYIVKNNKLISLLHEELKKKNNVNFISGSGLESVSYNEKKIISISKNNKIKSNLLIAADGKNSTVRKILGTNIFKKVYGEKALVINFFHEKSHENTAYEFFFKNGPMAILPMKKEKNQFQSTIIWSNKYEFVEYIQHLKRDENYIKEIINEKISGLIGKIIKINTVQAFPLSAHINEKFYSDKVIYIGDAAHSVHPIAGQGWNLGLRDIKSLIELLKNNNNNNRQVGSKEFCKHYNQLCYYDAYRLFEITDRLDWIFKKNQPHFKLLKKIGFKTINKNRFLKDKIVDFAMGV